MENIENYIRLLLLSCHSQSPHLLEIKFNLRQMHWYIPSNFQRRPNVYANYHPPEHKARAMSSISSQQMITLISKLGWRDGKEDDHNFLMKLKKILGLQDVLSSLFSFLLLVSQKMRQAAAANGYHDIFSHVFSLQY